MTEFYILMKKIIRIKIVKILIYQILIVLFKKEIKNKILKKFIE